MTAPRLTPNQPIARPNTAHGAEAIGVGMLVYYWMRYREYRRIVGWEHANFRGFRIWLHERRMLVRAQPRLFPAIGLMAIIVVLACMLIGWNSGAGMDDAAQSFLRIVGLICAVVGLVGTRHQRPPREAVEEVNQRARERDASYAAVRYGA